MRNRSFVTSAATRRGWSNNFPSFPILPLYDRIRVGYMPGLHLCCVQIDLPAGTERENSEQCNFSQARAIFEIAAGVRSTFDRGDPVAMMTPGARQCRRRNFVGLHFGCRQQARLAASAAAEHPTIVPDEKHSAVGHRLVESEFFRAGRHQAAVIPGDPDWRPFTTRSEVEV